MNIDLLQPAATIAAELLRRTTPATGGLEDDVIASAFEQAYRGLELGLKRIHTENTRRAPASIEPLKI